MWAARLTPLFPLTIFLFFFLVVHRPLSLHLLLGPLNGTGTGTGTPG